LQDHTLLSCTVHSQCELHHMQTCVLSVTHFSAYLWHCLRLAVACGVVITLWRVCRITNNGMCTAVVVQCSLG
jgi:hypothetical protein